MPTVLPLTGNIKTEVKVDEALAPGLESGPLTLDNIYSHTFDLPVAATDTNLKWTKSSTLAASTSETWTLSNLTDGLGRTIAFARIRYFSLENQGTNTGDDLDVGNAAANPWAAPFGASTNTFKVKSLGREEKQAWNSDGFVVTVGSSDQLKIANNSTHPIVYKIILLGSSS